MKTIAELEVLHFLKKISDGDVSMMVIDSGTPAWVEKGIIPGMANIPWDTLNIGKSEPAAVQEILENQLRAGDRAALDAVPGLRGLKYGRQKSKPWLVQSRHGQAIDRAAEKLKRSLDHTLGRLSDR